MPIKPQCGNQKMSHKCPLRAKLSLGEKWQLLPNVYIHWQLRVSPKSDKCFSGGTSTLVDSCSFQIHDHKYQNMLWIASYPKAQLHKWKKKFSSNLPPFSHARNDLIPSFTCKMQMFPVYKPLLKGWSQWTPGACWPNRAYMTHVRDYQN